ncbi:MAG: Ni/Fe-hydrogenase, b-type cytochrome subunit [Gemmatimonadota bacterium]|nr:Ni/Fe-hydrogenase, b-type cytochrome subunit [Gemmatimonadota bacterium]
MESTAAPTSESLSRDAPVRPYKEVYLWHWPVRAMHWIAAGCILVLVVTGFYIGRPYFFTSGSASDHFMMGRFRFVHFVAAGVLVATGILRAYWLFAGNKFERLGALFPIRRRDWVNMFKVGRAYLFVRQDEAPAYMGHNPLQQLSYTGIYLLALLQVATGFYLYGLANPGGFFFTWFAWVGTLFGGAQLVRFVHHILTWFWLIFIPIHIYLTVRADVLHEESRVGSMINGKRPVRADLEFVDD